MIRRSHETDLLERDLELQEVASLLEAVTSLQGGLLVIEGVAGMGKSRLLDVAIERAGAAGISVRAVRGDYLERSYAWHGAAALLEEAELVPHRDGEEAALELLRGLTLQVGALTEEAPLLLVIDDAHWIDAPTLRFVHFLAGRLEGLGAGVLIAHRPYDGDTVDRMLLRAIAAHPRAQSMLLAPLGAEAVRRLVRDALGAETSSELCERCAELTGGNPYYLRELIRSLAESTGPPTPALLDSVAPPTLARSVLIRLSHAGPDAARVAEALVVMGEHAQAHHIAVLAELDIDTVLRQADALTAADLVRFEQGMRFAHPLVRAVVESDMPTGRRQALHARAALLLLEEDAPPEAVAVHLLPAPPRAVPGAAETLRRAAARAIARGAPASAVTYLQRAILEPEDRMGIRGELAEAAVAAGTSDAVEHLEQALLDRPAGVERARLHLTLGWALHAAARFGEAASVFDAGLADTPEENEQLRVELRTGALTSGMLDAGRAAETHRRLARLGDLPRPRDAAERHHQSQLLVLALFSGATPAPELASFAERQLSELGRGVDRIHDWTRWNVIGTLSWCDRFDSALRSLDPLLTGDASLRVAMASYARAWPSLWTGRVAQAAEDARRAVDLWTAGAETYLPAAAYWLVTALCEQEQADHASAVLTEIDADRWRDTAFYGFLMAARGRLAAAAGDLEGAASEWLACGAHITDVMRVNNPSLLAWRSEAAMLLARLQDRDTARLLAAEDLSFAEGFQAPRALGLALRADAAAKGGDAGIEALERAIAVLEESGAKLEHAHALVDLGAALRRSGSRSRARDPLRAGLAAAQRFGAFALASRAREELLASGAKGLAPSIQRGLTPGELRVAELAAQGLTNRKIAVQLFVTVKAVEFHLSRVFSKLGISGRRELAQALTQTAGEV
jgi:DNA-binding CsgD family transcriptional regulator